MAAKPPTGEQIYENLRNNFFHSAADSKREWDSREHSRLAHEAHNYLGEQLAPHLKPEGAEQVARAYDDLGFLAGQLLLLGNRQKLVVPPKVINRIGEIGLRNLEHQLKRLGTRSRKQYAAKLQKVRARYQRFARERNKRTVGSPAVLMLMRHVAQWRLIPHLTPALLPSAGYASVKLAETLDEMIEQAGAFKEVLARRRKRS